MSIRSILSGIASGKGLATTALLLAVAGTAAHQWARSLAAEPGELSRAVWACDKRKLVIVEGVASDERMNREKAQQVASLLTDLMRFCEREVTARIGIDEMITLSVDGMPYVQYVPGGPLPTALVHNAQPHSQREQTIWKAELDRMVAEGDRLFHSDELGTNGIACAMCHPDASNTHPETYPKFQTQIKKVVMARDMVNWCIENPLEGEPLAADDPKMVALEAYMLSKRAGVPLAIGKH